MVAVDASVIHLGKSFWKVSPFWYYKYIYITKYIYIYTLTYIYIHIYILYVYMYIRDIHYLFVYIYIHSGVCDFFFQVSDLLRFVTIDPKFMINMRR